MNLDLTRPLSFTSWEGEAIDLAELLSQGKVEHLGQVLGLFFSSEHPTRACVKSADMTKTKIQYSQYLVANKESNNFRENKEKEEEPVTKYILMNTGTDAIRPRQQAYDSSSCVLILTLTLEGYLFKLKRGKYLVYTRCSTGRKTG